MHRDHNRRVTALTVGLVTALVAMTISRACREQAGAPAGMEEGGGPQEAVYAAFDAARAGDARGYLERFTGTAREELERTAAEGGEEKFGRYLREAYAGVKGIAVNEPKEAGEGEVEARVEYVYADRNEAQAVRLKRAGGVWRIAKMERSERVKAPVAYGTPAQ